MPKVWIAPDEEGQMDLYTVEHPDGMPVEMKASLYRQILAANKQYLKFQGIMHRIYQEAVGHPETIRRIS